LDKDNKLLVLDVSKMLARLRKIAAAQPNNAMSKAIFSLTSMSHRPTPSYPSRSESNEGQMLALMMLKAFRSMIQEIRKAEATLLWDICHTSGWIEKISTKTDGTIRNGEI